MLPLSRRGVLGIFERFQHTGTSTILSRFFGRNQQSPIVSCWTYPNNYLLSPKRCDCKWISSTPTPFSIHQAYSKAGQHRDNSRNASIAINKKIVALGSANDWRGILELFSNHGNEFRDVNFATAMMHFLRITSFDRSDTRFLAFLDSILENIEKRGLSWLQPRPASNIIYVIGKLKLVNPSTQRILGWISRKDIADQFVEKAFRNGQYLRFALADQFYTHANSLLPNIC